jgi:ATP-dependent NAD(P)H-hydrate dehydratase
MLVNRAIFEINSSLPTDPMSCFEGEIASRLRDSLISGSLPEQLHSLCAFLGGVTVILKGEYDMVCGSTLSQSATSVQPLLSFDGISDVFIIQTSEKGAPRRCGGQGDILSGCVATALYWSSSLNSSASVVSSALTSLQQPFSVTLEERQDGEGSRDLATRALACSPSLLGCILAATVVRAASSAAFLKKGRAMTSPDILEELGRAFERSIEGQGGPL